MRTRPPCRKRRSCSSCRAGLLPGLACQRLLQCRARGLRRRPGYPTGRGRWASSKARRCTQWRPSSSMAARHRVGRDTQHARGGAFDGTEHPARLVAHREQFVAPDVAQPAFTQRARDAGQRGGEIVAMQPPARVALALVRQQRPARQARTRHQFGFDRAMQAGPHHSGTRGRSGGRMARAPWCACHDSAGRSRVTGSGWCSRWSCVLPAPGAPRAPAPGERSGRCGCPPARW